MKSNKLTGMGQKRKINRRAYNKELIKRGSLTFLFSEDVAHNRYNTSKRFRLSKSLYRLCLIGLILILFENSGS